MIRSGRLSFATERETHFVDITSELESQVAAAGLQDGRVHIQSLHTTLGLVINEHEPLLLADFDTMLERLAPRTGIYLHDDFAQRVGIPDDEPANGHAHCRTLLLAPSLTVLVEAGRLVLGRWQSVFAVDLDGPRQRQLAYQLEGEFTVRQVHPNGHSNGHTSPRDLVERELRRQLGVDPDEVREPMRRLVEAGGKRIRPALVSLAGRLGPDHDPLRTSTLAAAVELIHAASLVHDDYVDEAPVRRGRPTVAALEGPRRAIEVGDFYFAKATRVIAELGSPDVTSTIAEAIEAICRSQIDDVNLRGHYPGDRDSYLQVVRGKTAALMSAACVSGAQLSGANGDVVEAVRRYGDLVGTAFQMVDDVVDYSGASGKAVGQDIRQRTLSLPLIYAIDDRRHGDEVRRLLDSDLGDGDVARVTELVERTGALGRVATEARRLVDDAMAELEVVREAGVREELAALAASAVDRVS